MGRSLLAPTADPNSCTKIQETVHTLRQDQTTRTGEAAARVSRIHRSLSQTPKDSRESAAAKPHTMRNRKALSLVSTRDVFEQSSLLSEITRSLKVSNLLSYESIAAVAPSTQIEPKSPNGNEESLGSLSLHDEVFLQDVGSHGASATEVAQPNDSSEKSVSFLWRVLGRARPDSHANIYVVSIQAISKSGKDGVEVRKGQQLKALYRELDRVFIQTPCFKQGFVPYSMCRLSRKHYGLQSKLIQLSYLRLYPQSPDGIGTLPVDQIPRIKMVAVKGHIPSSHEELSAVINETFTILYCDTEWIYASSGKCSGLLPRFTCDLTQDSKRYFEQWDQKDQPFQSDFIMKYDEARPRILEETPVRANLIQKTGSKVGKMFTIIQNFVPTSTAPTSGTFTIRKGLRVRIVEESAKQVRVTTKTGTSFWIPQNHVRPARKNSVADKFVQAQQD